MYIGYMPLLLQCVDTVD